MEPGRLSDRPKWTPGPWSVEPLGPEDWGVVELELLDRALNIYVSWLFDNRPDPATIELARRMQKWASRAILTDYKEQELDEERAAWKP